MKFTFTSLPVLWVAALLLSGCATPKQTDDQARALCVKTFGTDANFKLVWLSANRVNGFQMKVEGDEGLQSEITNAMKEGKDKKVDLVVWTETNGAPVDVIERALQYIPRSVQLTKLRFLYVGDPADAERLRPQIASTGAKFVFVKRG
jgi:hypothetical protein